MAVRRRAFEYRSEQVWGNLPVVHVAVGGRQADGRESTRATVSWSRAWSAVARISAGSVTPSDEASGVARSRSSSAWLAAASARSNLSTMVDHDALKSHVVVGDPGLPEGGGLLPDGGQQHWKLAQRRAWRAVAVRPAASMPGRLVSGGSVLRRPGRMTGAPRGR